MTVETCASMAGLNSSVQRAVRGLHSAAGLPAALEAMESMSRSLESMSVSPMLDAMESMSRSLEAMKSMSVSPLVDAMEASESLLARVRAMKPSLPGWYLQELAACAKAAGVDPDVLLYAQCEGDIRSLTGCSTYVAFGDATAGTGMEIGRSFDYWGFGSTESGAVILAVHPRKEDGYAFVSVGWAGILGGWTFINEKGVFVANNLRGGGKKDPKGIPTLIMERIIAQKAATVRKQEGVNRYRLFYWFHTSRGAKTFEDFLAWCDTNGHRRPRKMKADDMAAHIHKAETVWMNA